MAARDAVESARIVAVFSAFPVIYCELRHQKTGPKPRLLVDVEPEGPATGFSGPPGVAEAAECALFSR